VALPLTKRFLFLVMQTGAGCESMTFGFGPQYRPSEFSALVLENQEAADCRIPMGITSENVRSFKLLPT
jgi:hypothetical protein